MAGLARSIAPTALPVDLDAAKTRMRIEHDDEDDLIESLIAAATDDAENRLHRALLPQTWALSLDELPGYIVLPWPVARSVTIEYRATAGAWTSIDADEIFLSTGPPSFVMPSYGLSWPTPIDHPDAARVTFEAYSWSAPALVPAGIRQWILARVGELHEQLEASGPVVLHSHKFIDNLLAPWIVPDYAWRYGKY